MTVSSIIDRFRAIKKNTYDSFEVRHVDLLIIIYLRVFPRHVLFVGHSVLVFNGRVTNTTIFTLYRVFYVVLGFQFSYHLGLSWFRCSRFTLHRFYLYVLDIHRGEVSINQLMLRKYNVHSACQVLVSPVLKGRKITAHV